MYVLSAKIIYLHRDYNTNNKTRDDDDDTVLKMIRLFETNKL